MRSAVVGFCALLLGCSTYVQHRAALVPHATPVHTIGQPNTSRLAAALGASNIVDVAAPTAGDPNAGVAIPSKQLRGSFGVALTRNLSLAWNVEDGLASSAQPVKDTLPPLDDNPVVGNGPSLSYSVDTHSPWRIGLELEFLAWRIPWVEYSTCIDFCPGGPTTIVTHSTTTIATMAFGVVPSYRAGDWTFFGGVTLRNHPTIEEKIITDGFSADVEGGPLNGVLHGGVAYNASDRVRFVVEMHQTVTQDPVAYAPGVGFSFELGLGPDVEPPRHAPVVLPPGVTPAYPAPGVSPGYPPPAASPYPPPSPASPANAAAAAQLQTQAHAAAQAGECDEVRADVARIRELDAATYAAALQDKLIAYCVAP